MLDALTLDQIRMFVTVAEAGSFRAGAARLLRAQSAVSHAIANLENQLGVAVFDRSGHRPTLTAAGAALLEDARAVLLKVDFLRARARGLGEGVETEIALVVDTLYPLPLAAAALGELRAALPSVRLRLEHACDLLSSTDYSISEIGAACGFDNSCSFARAFRARFLSTATAYRQTAREAARIRANVGTGTKPLAHSAYATRNVMWSGL